MTARDTVTAAIEQARARGLTIDQTAALLDVEARRVRKVWDRMDEVALETDVPAAVDDRTCPEIGPGGRILEPHGTHAAFYRHKQRGQDPCPACRIGERAYQTGRKRRARQAREAAA